MTYDDWKATDPREFDPCPACYGAGCSECTDEPSEDDTPLCNCGTCTPPHFTCIRED